MTGLKKDGDGGEGGNGGAGGAGGNGGAGGAGGSGAGGAGGGQPRHDRFQMERQLPYSAATFVRSERHIFNGIETNFPAWKWRMEHQLRRMGVIHTLLRTPPEEEYAIPVENEEEEEERKKKYKQRMDEDEIAIDEIVMCVDNNVLNKLVGLSYAKEAMDTLTKAYQKTGTGSIINMRQRLFMLRSKKFESLEKLFDEYDLIVRELDRMGAEVSVSEKVHSLIIAMPDRFKHVKGALTVLSNEELCRKSISEIKRMFVDADVALPACSSNDNNVALKAAGSKTGIQCYGCLEYGHYKSRCPRKNGQLKPNQDQRNQDQKNQKTQRTNTGRDKGRYAMTVAVKGMVAKESTAGKAKPKQERRVRFVVDSGATEHLVNDERILEDATDLDKSVEINTAKAGQVLHGVKRGKVTLKSKVGLNKIKKLELYNVLFVPELESNLFSVRRASSMGKRVTFLKNKVTIDCYGETLAEGNIVDDLYCFEFELCYNVNSAAMIGRESQVSLARWHERLGHLSIPNIRKLLNNKMAEGINISPQNTSMETVCASCMAGKQSSIHFKTVGPPRSSRPLELVHTDVCGSMESSTYDGYKYFVSFIDDYTHFTVVYLLNKKSEVFSKLQEYEAMAVAHFGQKMSRLRCDNGGEYVGQDIKDFCRMKGIQLTYTVPYTPQQNGVSERMNRTLMDKVRAMLHGSRLSKKMWGEALYSATYLTNRSPTNGLVENKTPFELWFDKRPDLANIRTFGCKAYSQIPNEKRQKLDWKSKCLTFVGYANNGYRLWNSEKRKIEVSRNVVFDESTTDTDSIETVIKIVPNPQEVEVIQEEQSEDAYNETEEESETEESSSLEDTESYTDCSGSGDEEQETTSDGLESHDEEDQEQSVIEIPDDEEESGKQMTVRRSQRNIKKPDRFAAQIASVACEEIPQTIDELKNREDWPQWKIAIQNEMKSLEENKTWKVIKEPVDKKPIKSKWVFSIKDDGRYKARLVAKGYSQRQGFDYQETYAPVAKMGSVRTVLSLANEQKLLVHQMDVTTAFLNGKLSETIFMQLPCDEIGNSQVVHLHKSLYGLKQASRSWNERFDTVIKQLGFTQLKSDSCVYKSKSRNLILVLYVDDILIVGKHLEDVDWIKSNLGRIFRMKDLKEVRHFLGMDIDRDFENQTLKISQTGYTEKVLKRFNMHECKPVGTPCDANVKWVECKGKQTEHPYKELLGCLQYLSMTSRPDISAAVSLLSKYQSKPSDEHWAGLKRILRYLRGTMHTKICYAKRDTQSPVLGYADADFANDQNDRKSVSGYAFLVYGNLVAWSTKRQQTVSLSSTEAELIALSAAVKEGLWLTNLLTDLEIECIPFIIREDNIPCIKCAEEPRSNQRMKHLDVKYMFIRETIRTGKLQLQYIPTGEQPADAFTKGLSKKQHRLLFERLNLRIEGKC